MNDRKAMMLGRGGQDANEFIIQYRMCNVCTAAGACGPQASDMDHVYMVSYGLQSMLQWELMLRKHDSLQQCSWQQLKHATRPHDMGLFIAECLWFSASQCLKSLVHMVALGGCVWKFDQTEDFCNICWGSMRDVGPSLV